MRISWKWLSECVDLGSIGTPEKLAELLTLRGLEIEDIQRQDKGFEKVIVAKVLEKRQHPQADRLSICKVNNGSSEVQIVCGAANVAAGQTIALAQPGADLPNGLKIAESKIRGELSQGMICSESELGLKAESEGIWVLPSSLPIGQPLAQVLKRDDTVLTLKITPNRGDCLSHLGIAREVAAATGGHVKLAEGSLKTYAGSPIKLALEAGEEAPQFYGALIEGVKIGPSPDWLVNRLEALGSRSINNVVDATNLVMLELGHPVHAYDADLIDGGTLTIRLARAGEKLKLLDDTEIDLRGHELIVADAKKPVALGGVMGGGNSEVRESTTRIFLECAEFSSVRVRRAASLHQKRTDASQRFERGVDPQGLDRVMARLESLVRELAGGKLSGTVRERLPSRDPGKSFKPAQVEVEPTYFGRYLGMALEPARARASLEGLGCKITETAGRWTVVAPTYRLDIAIREDLCEEIARTIGYDQVPSTIPKLTGTPLYTADNPSAARWRKQSEARRCLAAAGLSESIHLSFTSRKWLEQLGFSTDVRIINPLSEEHEVMVPSLLPGLIRAAQTNWNHHFGSEPLAIRLFEFRPTFERLPEGQHSETAKEILKNTHIPSTGVRERLKLAIVLSGPRYAEALRSERGEVDFYDLKAVIERLFAALGARGTRVLPMTASRKPHPLFHPGQSAEILAGNAVAGHFGLLHPSHARTLKTRAPLWLAELDWDALAPLLRAATEVPKFKAWSEFPGVERDYALLVKEDVTSDKITQAALKAAKPLAQVVKVFDVYRGEQVPKGMTSVAVRVIFLGEGRSLQEAEVESASAKILEAWKKELHVELRG